MFITIFRNDLEGGMSFSEVTLAELKEAFATSRTDLMTSVEAELYERVTINERGSLSFINDNSFQVFTVDDECELDTTVIIGANEGDCAIQFYTYHKERK